MQNSKSILYYVAVSIVGVYFLFLGLIAAKAFLAPLITAIILALVVLPLAQRIERGGVNRMASSLLNTFMLFLASMGFVALILFQGKNFISDWPQIKETMQPKINEAKSFVFQHTPLQKEDLKKLESKGISFIGSSSDSEKQAANFLSSLTSFFGNYLLTFIYIFFLLNYRRRFKKFLLCLFPNKKHKKVKHIILESVKLAPKYLWGRFMLIGFLAIIYSIGLGISGVDNFILISVIAAFFSLVPYVGNIVGLAMAMAFGYLSSGDPMTLIGIVATFSIAQFVESYFLEPYVVGDQVDVHPFIVILVVVAGNLVWGVIGMVLAIPITAIVTVVILHIPELKPFGVLLSKEKFDKEI